MTHRSPLLKRVFPTCNSRRVRCRSGMQDRMAKIRYRCRLQATAFRSRNLPLESLPAHSFRRAATTYNRKNRSTLAESWLIGIAKRHTYCSFKKQQLGLDWVEKGRIASGLEEQSLGQNTLDVATIEAGSLIKNRCTKSSDQMGSQTGLSLHTGNMEL